MQRSVPFIEKPVTYEEESEAFAVKLCPCGREAWHPHGCGWRGEKGARTRLWHSVRRSVDELYRDSEIEEEDLAAGLVLLAGGISRNPEIIAKLTGVAISKIEIYAERYTRNRIWRDNCVWFGRDCLDTNIPLIMNIMAGNGVLEVVWDENDSGIYSLLEPTFADLAQWESDGGR